MDIFRRRRSKRKKIQPSQTPAGQSEKEENLMDIPGKQELPPGKTAPAKNRR